MGKDPFKKMIGDSQRCKDLRDELNEMLNNNEDKTDEKHKYGTELSLDGSHMTGLTPECGQSYANLPEKVFDMYLATQNIYREGSAIPSYDTKDEKSVADQCREFFKKHPNLESVCENAYNKLELYVSEPDGQGKMMLVGAGRSRYSMRVMDSQVPEFHDAVFDAMKTKVIKGRGDFHATVREIDQIGNIRLSYEREEIADVILNLYQNKGNNGINQKECQKFFEKYPELEEVCQNAVNRAREEASTGPMFMGRFTYRDIMHYNGWDHDGYKSFDERIADTINKVTRDRRLRGGEIEEDAKCIDFSHQKPNYPYYAMRGRGGNVNE